MSKEKRHSRRQARRENRAAKGGNVFQRAATKVKAANKKIGTKVGAAIKKGAKAAAKGVVGAPLIPFRGLMEKQLKKRGVAPKKKLTELAQQFFQNVVKKSEGFENVEPATITLVITAIIGFFKKMKEKKAAKQALTQEQQEILDQVEEIGIAAAEINENVGGFLDDEIIAGVDGKTVLLGLGLLAAIIYVKSQS